MNEQETDVSCESLSSYFTLTYRVYSVFFSDTEFDVLTSYYLTGGSVDVCITYGSWNASRGFPRKRTWHTHFIFRELTCDSISGKSRSQKVRKLPKLKTENPNVSGEGTLLE